MVSAHVEYVQLCVGLDEESATCAAARRTPSDPAIRTNAAHARKGCDAMGVGSSGDARAHQAAGSMTQACR
jgi:hypothetical protein